MLETLDQLWDTAVQGWWIQPLWIMICAFWGLHTILRGVHVAVTWPSDRTWRMVWVIVSAICFLYFLGQVRFADHPQIVPFGILSRNIVSVLLVVMLIVDVLRGIKGTASRRALRAHKAQSTPPELGEHRANNT